MCSFKNGLIFCTCDDPRTIIHHKKKRRKAGIIEYLWELRRCVGEASEMIAGLYEMPSSQLGDALTATQVLEALHTGAAFDFDYQPVEGDSLSVYTDGTRDYMEFLYREGQWVEDQHSPFMVETEKLLNGKVLPR